MTTEKELKLEELRTKEMLTLAEAKLLEKLEKEHFKELKKIGLAR